MFGLSLMFVSCASTVYTSTTGTLYGDYDYITDVYYESNRDLIVVYIEHVPYYKLWDYAKMVYYYSPVPRSYWRNITYRPYIYGYPKYYRHLPPPYKRPAYRPNRPVRPTGVVGGPDRPVPKPKADKPMPRPNRQTGKPNVREDRSRNSSTTVRQRPTTSSRNSGSSVRQNSRSSQSRSSSTQRNSRR